MLTHPLHDSPIETARLQALQSYGILDTPPEEGFDQLVQLAAQLCQCPMAVVNFVDGERQWFKAAIGMPFKTSPRTTALCVHALSGSSEPLVVPDATLHPALADNPMVRAQPHIRLYAGVPLLTEDGQALGTLAVFDRGVRTLLPEQITALQMLAAQVMDKLEHQRQKVTLQALVHDRENMHAALLAQQSAQDQAQEKLRLSEERFELLSRATADAVWDWDLRTDAMWWNEGMQTLFGIPRLGMPSDSTSWSLRIHPEDSQEVLQGIEAAIVDTANHWSAQYRFRRYDGSYAWVQDRGFLIRDAQGTAVRMVGGMTDISVQKIAQSEAEQDAKNHADLVQLQQRISSIDMPLPEVLHMVVTTVLQQSNARGALIELLQDGCTVVQASVGDHIRPTGHRLPLNQSLLWSKLSNGRTVSCSDTLAQGWDMSVFAHRQGVRSVVAVPLRSGDAVIGAIKVTSNQTNAFAPRDVAHLEILAESVGAMVQLRHLAGQLRASEQQYRMLFDMHPHPMWVYDAQTLQLRAVNQAMKSHYGYTEAQLLGMCMSDLWKPEQRKSVHERIRKFATGALRGTVISRHMTQDG
ncbi:MAG: PAS domain S-box protein, partial [Burkholderiaceae bacterium]|nr:PAS domain S-box protein [Burkholderiaceae bacterium]